MTCDQHISGADQHFDISNDYSTLDCETFCLVALLRQARASALNAKCPRCNETINTRVTVATDDPHGRRFSF